MPLAGSPIRRPPSGHAPDGDQFRYRWDRSGPASDRAGNIFAVNFAQQQTIGRTTPAGQSEVFVTLPKDSVGNGIRFDRAGRMYVADYVGHNVLRIDPGTRAVEVLAHVSRR